MRLDRRFALWLFDNIPLRGPFARWPPYLLGYALGSKPRRVEPPDDTDDA